MSGHKFYHMQKYKNTVCSDETIKKSDDAVVGSDLKVELQYSMIVMVK